MSNIKVTILGSGGSFGVPVLSNRWGNCDPKNPKNIRTRPGAIIEKNGKTILIDANPDLRQQLIANKITSVNSVLFTHAHADHTHGINDLRAINLSNGHRLPVFADQKTKISLLNAFEYIFKSKNMAQYPPICEIIEYEAGKTYQIDGFKIDVIKQNHGNMDSLGYVIDDKIAYNLDVKFFYDETYLDKIKEIDCLIIGCLRYEEHPAHADYEQILQWIEYVKPKVAYLSHMTALIDYVTEYEKLSKINIFPSYDGCVINL